jgi:hypothetical protein
MNTTHTPADQLVQMRLLYPLMVLLPALTRTFTDANFKAVMRSAS